jgi:hypothetical protein
MLTMGRPLKMGGNAWQYLTDSVAGAAELGADTAGYYAAKETPPGRFLGRGLDGLGPCPGSVKPGDVVSPEMLHRMLAQLADPITGQALGRLPSAGQRALVAGYDLTFHPPKSVSLMWAMGDQATRDGIEEGADPRIFIMGQVQLASQEDGVECSARCRPRHTLVGPTHGYLGKLRRRHASPGRLAGGIFWLTRKRFCESYLALIEVKRS